MYRALIVVRGVPRLIQYKDVPKHIEGVRVEIVARDKWRAAPIVRTHGTKILDLQPVGGVHKYFSEGSDQVVAVFHTRNLKDRDQAIVDLCTSLISLRAAQQNVS